MSIMKIERIASTAMSVLSILLVASCQKQKTEPESEPAAPVTFSVALRGAEKDYAELVVRHDGEESDTWYGFLTTDITTPVDELVAAKRSQVSKDDLHIGKSQTVGLSDLEDLGTYRYIAFGVTREDAKAGSLIFTTLPDFMVDFTVEVSSVESHEAAFNISHDGNEAITYASFLTDDMESELAILVNEAYLSMTTDGKLNDDVTLLVGKEAQVTVKELVHEKDYRFLVFGLFVTEEGAAVLYGTPAECSVTTPLDPALVTFSATVSNIKKNSVTVTVDYDAKAEELPWYAFVTEDKTTSAADLIAGVVEQGIAEEEIYKGAQELAFTDLTPETEYRIIVFGYDENGVYGISADKAFTTLTEAYDQCVFRVEVKEINATGVTLTITHNGNEDFQYVGYLTTDLTTPTAELTIPDELVTNLLTGVEKEVVISDLEPNTEYRYIVAGIYDGNEYGTRGEVKFETADYAVQASYEDFLGEWAVQMGTPYEFTIEEKKKGESYLIAGLGAASTARYGINSPLVVEGLFVDGKLTLASQAISAVYEDPEDGLQYVDSFCGTYYASDGSQYYDKTMGQVLVTFAMLEDGTVELRPGNTANGDKYRGMRFYQVPVEGSTAYFQDAVETLLPNAIKRAETASEAYNKWLGTWNVNGTSYYIQKSETNKSYVMGSFYSGFTVNAPVKFDAATGNILFVYGQTGQSVTSSGLTYNLYCAGSYNDGYIANGGSDGIICRFSLSANGNSADINPATYDYNGSSITPEYFGIYGNNATSGWANFGMQIAIPLTITRVSNSTAIPQGQVSGAAIQRVKDAPVSAFVK